MKPIDPPQPRFSSPATPSPSVALANDQGAGFVQNDVWVKWREFTPARIALGRVGASQPTHALLNFSMAHASARDAVYEPLDLAGLAAQLSGLRAGEPDGLDLADVQPSEHSTAARWIHVHSGAIDRAQYLRRPDLGRRLDPASRERLQRFASQSDSVQSPDLVFIIADGLSALAASRHAVPVIKAMRARLTGWRIGPVVIAEQARVALGDEVGQCLAARCVAILIGERPGLSSPDSLGIYLTWAPRVGRTDAERNCISNIRPAGLSYEQAAIKLGALLEGAKRLGATGVELKDEAGTAQLLQAGHDGPQSFDRFSVGNGGLTNPPETLPEPR